LRANRPHLRTLALHEEWTGAIVGYMKESLPFKQFDIAFMRMEGDSEAALTVQLYRGPIRQSDGSLLPNSGSVDILELEQPRHCAD
jgi:hypothetical protein